MGRYFLDFMDDRHPTIDEILLACREGLVDRDEARAELERLKDDGVFAVLTTATRELLARLTRLAAVRPYVAADNPWRNQPVAARAGYYVEASRWDDDGDVA